MKKLLIIPFLFMCSMVIGQTYNPASIIGKSVIIAIPIVRIDNLEVAQFDFPDSMDWQNAKDACDALGDGWRLPTKDEWKIIYQNKNEIGGFDLKQLDPVGTAYGTYWSSDDDSVDSRDNDTAWLQSFNWGGLLTKGAKNDSFNVRAVRSF
jgi:hypothetical protein